MNMNELKTKRLIDFDEAEYNTHFTAFTENLEILNQIAEEYETLGIGQVTPEIMEEILHDRFEGIEELLINAVGRSVKNKILADKAIELAGETLESFRKKMKPLSYKFQNKRNQQGWTIVTGLEFYSMTKKGRFYIPETSFQRIKDERCSNFIETQEQEHIYDLLKKHADLTNEIYETLGKRVRHHFDNEPYQRHVQISELFTDDKDGKTIVDPKNNYQYLTE
jgi:hypothetical protein